MAIPVAHAHATILVFYAPEEKKEDVKTIIAKVIKNIAPFDVKLEGLGHFNNNQILFAKPTDGSNKLKHLNNVFYKALTEAGFICNDKPYNPHVTILKSGKHMRMIPSKASHGEKEKYFGTQRVSEIQISMLEDKLDGYALKLPQPDTRSTEHEEDLVRDMDSTRQTHKDNFNRKKYQMCPDDCRQTSTCRRICDVLDLLKQVTRKMGDEYPIFKDVEAIVVGSLKGVFGGNFTLIFILK